MGTPTGSNWPEGLRLAAVMNFRFPSFAPQPLAKLLPSASPEAVDLIAALCAWDPNRRPSAAQALQHPFFQVPMDRHVQRCLQLPLGLTEPTSPCR
jgi:protein kinase